MRRMCRSTGVIVRLAAGCFVTALLLPALGCFPYTEKTPTQVQQEDNDRIFEVRTIKDVADVSNELPLMVQGVGLVRGLGQNGGGTPPGQLRMIMEKILNQQQVPNPKQLIDSPDSALVVVTGIIPPGSRKGDLFDVRVTLPQGSKVKSLRGGYLEECRLRIYDTKLHLNPEYRKQDGSSVLAGQEVARAGGYLIVGMPEPPSADAKKPQADGGDKDAKEPEPDMLSGDIWEGAVSYIDRPYHFILNDQNKKAVFADAVAERINAMFQDDPRKRLEVQKMKDVLLIDQITSQLNGQVGYSQITGQNTARAMNKDLVLVNVPWEYRFNSQRYIFVARLMPLAEKPEERQPYRHRLEVMLHDPAFTVRAALRLEALGRDSIPVLKAALSDRHPLVRFAAAEALCYLSDGSGVAQLGQLAHEYPQLRAFCLIALSSLEQTTSRSKLTELLNSDKAEIRYGAFRGLQLQNVADASISGEQVGAFRLHRLPSKSPGMVHYALNHRAEIVLFGQTPMLVPPFTIRAGEFNITATPDDWLCTIGRYQPEKRHIDQKQCSCRLDEVLITLAEMGADYPMVVTALRRIDEEHALNCPVYLNAMPQPMLLDDLQKSGLDGTKWNVDSGMPPAAVSTRPPSAPAHYATAISQPQ